jgi:DtxR family Mn-dependent transcriptional regulator
MQLSENMENYLEAILELESVHKVARVKDIADRLGIQRGSASGALRNLGEKGLIHYEPYSFITLTAEGRRIAEEIAERHKVLRDFLENILQIDPDTAQETACRMEHAIDEKTKERLIWFIRYILSCPRTGEQWLQSFIDFCNRGGRKGDACEECILSLKSESGSS